MLSSSATPPASRAARFPAPAAREFEPSRPREQENASHTAGVVTRRHSDVRGMGAGEEESKRSRVRDTRDQNRRGRGDCGDTSMDELSAE